MIERMRGHHDDMQISTLRLVVGGQTDDVGGYSPLCQASRCFRLTDVRLECSIPVCRITHGADCNWR